MSEQFWSDVDAAAQLETWQAAALAKYPDAAPLVDLLVGPNQEAVESLAADVANRIKRGTHKTEATGTGDAGGETQAPAPDAPRSSAAILQEVREGKHWNNQATARRDWIDAKLREAAGVRNP